MKSKALIAAAVASTFGWSAASFAGPGHEAVMPFSPNESGENIFHYQQGFGPSGSAFGAMSDQAGGTLGGSYSASASDLSTSGDDRASIGSDENLAAADDGLYTDYYVVSWTPVTGDGWDYYVIDDGGTPQSLAFNDLDVWMPTQDQLVLIPSTSTLDETAYDLALVPMTFDANSASIGSSDDLSGE